MAWLDDRAWCHPKLTRLSAPAHRAWVSAVCYSSGFGLHGRLEKEHQQVIGCSSKLRSELIAAGLWEDLGGGAIQIHDWSEHNEKRDAKRVSDRERKRRQRDRERDISRDTERDITRDTQRDRRALTNDRVKEVAKATSGKRAPDELWDALVLELGDVSTKTERGERNSAVKELREAGATAADIHLRCRAYRRKWPEMELTPSALKKHWSSLAGPPAREPQPIEVALDLPDVSDEERQENAARITALAASIGKDAA